jgi:hypothetical protein
MVAHALLSADKKEKLKEEECMQKMKGLWWQYARIELARKKRVWLSFPIIL